MSVKIRLNDQEFTRSLRRATAEGLQRATVFLHTQCRAAVNVPNTGVRRGRTTVYPHPSKPGEPPRKRTGWGQRHIVWGFDRPSMTGRVGVQKNAMYMIYLEIGTRRVQRRPWLVATLRKHSHRLAMLATSRGIK